MRTGGGISKPECGAFDRQRRGSGSVMSVRTDGLGGVPCAGSRGAAKDRPGGQRFCGHTPVATLWVGWTLKLSIGGSGRYFKKSKVSFSVQIPRTHLDLLLSYLWSLQIRFFYELKERR